MVAVVEAVVKETGEVEREQSKLKHRNDLGA
jgi:hypothetical protein